eukprot:s1689_g1.t1
MEPSHWRPCEAQKEGENIQGLSKDPVTQAPEGEDKAEDLADTYEGELAWMS